MNPTTRILTAAVATAAPMFAGQASADVLVHETFSYLVGPLAGQDGGRGLAGAWADGPDSGSAYVYDQTSGGSPIAINAGGINQILKWDGVVDNTPTFPLPPDAGYVGLADGSSGDQFEAYRPLEQSAGELAGDDNVLWMSAVWHYRALGFGTHVGLAFATDSFASRGNRIDTSGAYGSGAGNAIGVGRISTGFNGDGSNPTHWNNLSPMVFQNGSVAAQTFGDEMSGTLDNLVVLKFEFSQTGPDTVRAYNFPENVTPDQTTFDSNATSTSFVIDEDTLNILTFDQNRGENAIDEIRIGDSFDDVVAGTLLPETLTLRVDTVTGAMSLLGGETDSFTFNYYQLTSPGGSLNPAGWNSLADQDYDGNGPADGSGNGWEEGGGVDANVLAEAYLRGSSTTTPGEVIDLGAAYNPAVDARDLELRYRAESGQNFYGQIVYIQGLPGDTDNDGDIDDTDLSTAFSNYTGPTGTGKTAAQGDTDNDGDVDDTDLGTLFSGYTGPLGPAIVPEPVSALLLLGWGLARAAHRRR
ncbi:MAG: hypothetical protein ACE37H_04335 [Phycisphaeraceae bacterium]